jgi:predicted ribosome quality control (RQC) complex YloA/Tae2 family protein
MTIKLSSEALLHLLTEALKENEALEARLRKTEEARRKLSREKTALETKVANLRRAGLQLWAAMHLAQPAKKEGSLPKSEPAPTFHVEGLISLTKESREKKHPDVPSWMHAFKTWQCAASRHEHQGEKR